MGREVKRVSLDFDWPLRKVWEGYVSPDWRDCPADCYAGHSKTYRLMMDAVNSLMWSREGAKDEQYRQVTRFLAGRDGAGPLGHDSMDAWHAVKKLGELAGLPERWDVCPTCNGSGIHPDDNEAAHNWENTQPPDGEGWQVWENVSEGSPISPVFAKREDLEEWIVRNENCTPEAARKFVDMGFAFSAMMGPNGFKTGAQMYEDFDTD